MSTTHPEASRSARPYARLLESFPTDPHLLPAHLREDHMRQVADAAWEALSNSGVSWIGFYTKTPYRDEMVLGARRDKPACSPIGLHGMCGRSWYERKPIIVRDVATLGAAYIACDPKDRSEIVIPLIESDGTCYGVLDADSYEVGAFELGDVIGLTTLVEHAGLSLRRTPPAEVLRL